MLKKLLSFEVIVSFSAIICSFAAVYIAWDQTQVMGDQLNASVIPIVDVEVTLDRTETENSLAIDLTNVGVGPAMVKYARILIYGEEATRFEQVREKLLVEGLREEISIRAGSITGVLGAGQVNNAFKMVWDRSEALDAAFVEFSRTFLADDPDPLEIEICYCSVFNKCWTDSDDNQVEPKEVAGECPEHDRDIVGKLMASIE